MALQSQVKPPVQHTGRAGADLCAVAGKVDEEDIAGLGGGDDLLEMLFDVGASGRLLLRVCVDQDRDVGGVELVVGGNHLVHGRDIVDTAAQGRLGACTRVGRGCGVVERVAAEGRWLCTSPVTSAPTQ